MSHHELSFLLPHLLRDGRGKLDTYFSRVYNPVWTNPDGCMWMDVLADESLVGCHAALTPTWNETTLFFHVISNINRIKCNSSIKISKNNDKEGKK